MDHVELERQKFELTVLHRRIVQNRFFATLNAAGAVAFFLTRPDYNESIFWFLFNVTVAFVLFLFVRKYIRLLAADSVTYKNNLWKIRDAYDQFKVEESGV